MASNAPHRFYRFGPNVLDCLRGVLWQNGVQVTLTPRVFGILSTLVQHQGELVTKDDFMKLVWGGTAVEDNNLARQISTLRKLLHERPGQRDFIATVTGVGYRFVGTVTAFDEVPADLHYLLGDTPAETASATAAVPEARPEQGDCRDAEPDPASAVVAAPLLASVASAVPDVRAGRRAASDLSRGIVFIAGLGVATVALATMAWPETTANPAPVSRTLWQFSHGNGSQADPAWSPDGTRLALASDAEGSSGIWVHGVDDPLAIRLTSSAPRDGAPSWSPDGRSLVFRSERDGGGLFIVAATGGEERRLTTFGAVPQWSPKGDAILFSHAAPDSVRAIKLYVVSPSGGAPIPLTFPGLSGYRVRAAAWTPDGHVSIWARDGAAMRHFITVSIDGTSVRHSTIPADVASAESDTAFTAFKWAPSGRFLYFEGRSQAVRNLWRVAVDPQTLAWLGSPERLTVGPGADVGLSVSADGSKLAFGVNTAKPGIWAFPFDPATGRIGTRGKRIVSGDSGERGADASRDGRHILYRLSRANRAEIWEHPAGSAARLLVSDVGWSQTSPRWSPDHSRLAYQRSRTAEGHPRHRSVAVLDLDTGGRPVETIVNLGPSEEIIPTDWTSDGRSILAACRLAAGEPIGTCSLPAHEPGLTARPPVITRLASDAGANLFQQRYSPNQKWISFVAVPIVDQSVTTVYAMPAAGGPWRAITDGAAYDDKARWSPDGRILYYISNRDGRFEVWGRRFDPDAGHPQGEPFRVTSFEGTRQVLSPYLTDMEMFITPDRIFLPMSEASSRVWILDQVDR